jgi:hypothetical protein
MALRPNTLQVLSSTQIEIGFNKRPSTLITIDNFDVASSVGLADDIKITGIDVIETSILITTNPQNPGNLYLLTLKDSEQVLFTADDGDKLVNDDTNRFIYFIGSDAFNPVRDRIFLNIPKTYNLDGTNIKNIISSQADELYQIEKHIGEILSDNYISIKVDDELRVRGSAAKDRLANENAYLVESISRYQNGNNLIFSEIFFNSNSEINSQKIISDYPISLQQTLNTESILFSNLNSKVSGYLLTLEKKNIIKLESLKIIKEATSLCDKTEFIYNIDKLKYSIKNNKYDPKRSFSYIDLESNQILLSESSGFELPLPGDTIEVTYLYKDLSKKINLDSAQVYNIESVTYESVPQESTRFFLKNAPITNDIGELGSVGNILFYQNYQSSDNTFAFEIPFNTSKLPSKFGEFAVNYSTGEVILYGDKNKFGTSDRQYFVNYNYRKTYQKNLDYYLDVSDFVATSGRSLQNSNAIISFNYQQQFVENVDYKAEIHTETINEQVESNLLSSYTLKTKNAPITKVFSLFNQTTGETYQPVSFYKNEITFSGLNAPKFISKKEESPKFEKIQQEKIFPYFSFLSSIFTFKISENISLNNIKISPPMPMHLVDTESSDYLLKDSSGEIQNMSIKFFGSPDSNNNIDTIALTTSSDLPDLNKEYSIGLNCLSIKLKNKNILNKSNDAIGNFIDSSLILEENVFLNEKYFFNDKSYYDSTRSKLVKDQNNEKLITKTLSNLQKTGDYITDYNNGVIHVAVKKDYNINLGYVSYDYGKITADGRIIITSNGAYRKKIRSDQNYTYLIDKTKVNNGIELNNLNNSFEIPDGTFVNKFSNESIETNIVTDDYLVFTRLQPTYFYGLYRLDSIFGNNSINPDYRVTPGIKSDMSVPIANGGRNIYKNEMLIKDNYLDLKVGKKFKAKNISGFSFSIPNENFGFIYKITNLSKNIEISDQMLDGLKYKTEIYNTEDLGSESKLYIDADLYINLSNDYVKDSSNNKFIITSYNSLSGEVLVDNIWDGLGYILPVIGESLIVNEISITETTSSVIINISNECLINDNDQIEITYLNDFIPQPGTRVGTHYTSGSIYYDYTETTDYLVVSYEHGDNEINWQINNSISEREAYYVSYKYGALRDSLKNNFGLLTKIPFFTRFSQNTDRELYRSALQGVLESFSRGPTIGSFENLIEKFTEQKPNVEESFFGSWILGRDLLNPGGISSSGVLKFESGRFDSGLLIDDSMVITTPSKTSINLDEGTFSAWIRNDWYGINNDANIKFDFSKMSEINFKLTLNKNIFENQNFDLFLSTDRYGSTDWTGETIDLYNYQTIEEDEFVGPYGITKYHDRLNSSKFSKHSASISASPVGTLTSLSSFYGSDPGTLSERLSSFGMGGFTSGLPVTSRGFLGDGLEMFLSYYCSPFVFSIGDESKVFLLAGSLVPVKNVETDRLYVLRIEDEDTITTDFPNFDGPYIIKNCNCVEYNDISKLELFRDNNFNKIKINLTEGINISYLLSDYQLVDDKISGLKYMLDDGRIYSVLLFLDSDGSEISQIPEDGIIYGFIVNRIPDNQEYITQLGSQTINETKPSGTGILLIPVVSVIRSSFDSEELYSFDSRPLLVNFTDKSIFIDVERNPILNKVLVKINNLTLNIAYSDLLTTYSYTELFNFLNLNSWFNTESGIISEIDGINDLNNKIFIGTLDPIVKTKVSISDFKYKIEEGLSLSKIYLGPNKVNPSKYNFSINRFEDYIDGAPDIDAAEKSIYIWFDNDCRVDGNKVGSWKMKTVIPNQSIIATGVDGYTIDGYDISYKSVELQDYIEGSISTDGGFSYARSLIDEASCPTDPCLGSFRFCGQSLLETNGWKSIGNFGSDLINTIIGGTEYNINNWKKVGNFDSQIISNIYKIDNINEYSYLYLPLNCIQDLNYQISFKINDFDNSIIGSNSGKFSGNISGNLIGLTVAEIFDGNKNIKISLAASSTTKYMAIIDGISKSIIDLIPFDWNNFEFNDIQINLNKYNDIITIYHKSNIISRIKYSTLTDYVFDCNNILNTGIFLRLNDQSYVSSNFISTFNQIKLDIDYIELSLNSSTKDTNLEENDNLTIQQNSIDFKFYNKSDGYLDAYGYMESGSDIDTIVFVSDLDRYILDSGEKENLNRISIYKDFYGYLNFRIHDSLYRPENKSSYNVSSSIKEFEPGEFHHIGASWRVNTGYQKDEMHLFVDGAEVPSLYKFGGYISPWRDAKFGDIARDVIQDFSETKINYNESYTDGQILAGENYIISESANFSNNDIGKSIIISDGGLASELNGKAFIISAVDGTTVYLLDIESFTPYYFGTSSSSVEFYRPPYVAGSSLSTSFLTTKFELYKKTCKNDVEEFGGTLYTVENGVISIVQNNVINSKYRINLTNGDIDFLYKDSNCAWSKSVDISDLDIWIENFGLNKSRVIENINYSSNSILGPNYLDQISGFITNMPEPIDLSSVKITRVLLDSIIPNGSIIDGVFSFEITSELHTSSFYQSSNTGRLLSVKFESDNINYCSDGYSSENYIQIDGLTDSGVITEYIYPNENKVYNLNNNYLNITKISGSLNIVDENYEPLLISIFERDSITIQNNNGDYAEISKYSNGVFFITTYGTFGQINYQLPSGIYLFDYPSFLNLRLPAIGDEIFFGSDMFGKRQLGGLLDEVKIITEMSGDTRNYQSQSTFAKSITEEFVSNSKPCPDQQTIFLSHFDDPFEIQVRRLRNKVFLNTKDNYKYKLNSDDLETLSGLINNEIIFISEMKKMGHTEDIARETYVESHYADGGPLFNEARYSVDNKLIVGYESVNDNFGFSGKFYNIDSIYYNSPNIFDSKNGTIEFWISPLLSTDTDLSKRVIFDSYSAKTVFVNPTTTGIIELPTNAEKIVSIQLPQNRDSKIYKTDKYDEIKRSVISGVLEGGTGVLNDFSKDYILKNNGKIIVLKTKLVSKDPVLVTYIEKGSSESRIQSYYQNEKIFFEIYNDGSSSIVSSDIKWASNSWHKVAVSWKVNTGKDYIKMAIDGMTNSSSVLSSIIKIDNKLEQFNLGSSYDNKYSCLSRLDNFKISKIDRLQIKDISGSYLDLNYSSNLNTIKPVVSDIYTSYLNNFEYFESENNYITITDLVRGIFEFDIEVIDDFGKIKSSEVEDLIVYLVNKLKPSHTNVLVKFRRKAC